jgi:hypothetical protein
LWHKGDLSLLFVFKLNISLIHVHTITLKRRLNKLFDYLLKEKCLITFLKVKMTNLTLFVAVATVLFCELHQSI